ncbi:MAG: TetR/AcrR family transcriptional regulator [Deltaproteobacteria bacterium]|nr:TetR/AcrR family transcriptional regulator [Deltaproteobacteria bacterium]
MPRPRFERLDAVKRDGILDAAEQEFAAHGYSRASYNRVIEHAGVSKGAMYYYFDDKADLYLTVVRRAFSGVLEAVGEVDETDSPDGFWAQCIMAGERVAAYLGRDPRRAELARGLMRSLGEAPPGVREVFDEARVPIQRLLEAGQRAGAVRDDLPIGLLVAMSLSLGEAMDSWISHNWETLESGGYTALEPKLLGVFQRLCAPVSVAGYA